MIEYRESWPSWAQQELIDLKVLSLAMKRDFMQECKWGWFRHRWIQWPYRRSPSVIVFPCGMKNGGAHRSQEYANNPICTAKRSKLQEFSNYVMKMTWKNMQNCWRKWQFSTVLLFCSTFFVASSNINFEDVHSRKRIRLNLWVVHSRRFDRFVFAPSSLWTVTSGD